MRLAHASTELLNPGPAECHVPGWARPALRSRPPAWPEVRERFVLSLFSDDGAVGRFGPVSATTARIISDQLIPAVTGCRLQSWRWLEGLDLAGRHKHGSHFRVAWSAVELAAWDLRSAAHGSHVLEFLSSGPRPSIPLYASALGFDIQHPEAPNVARWLAEEGYYGQKWQLPAITGPCTPGRALRLAENIREAVGDETRLMIDAMGRWDHGLGRQMIRGLADLGVMWVEEPTAASRHGDPPPVPPGHEGLLAAGEHAYELAEQMSLVWHPSIGILQPDIGWCGGLTRALILTAVADAAGKVVIPHGGSFCPGLILAAASPDTVPAVEYHVTLEPERQAIYSSPVHPLHGAAEVPKGLGLGLEYRC